MRNVMIEKYLLVLEKNPYFDKKIANYFHYTRLEYEYFCYSNNN